METKTVYQMDDAGFYVGRTVADLSPLETNVWLIPRGCVTVTPPKATGGKVAKWDGSRWLLVELSA
jgi:penicillin V acylase-like amidase (Ntn superfamily)